MSYINFLFLHCRFSNERAWHVHLTPQAAPGNAINCFLDSYLGTWVVICWYKKRKTILLL